MTSDETCKCGGRCGGVTPSEPYARQLAGFTAYKKATAEQATASIAAREAHMPTDPLLEQVAERIRIGEKAVAAVFRDHRVFTRAEVLAVLKSDLASRGSDVRPDETALLRHLIRVFERME